MPPTPLIDLSAELLIQVYKSLSSEQDVTALNLVSHQFYDLWFSDTIPISKSVLSRTIKSFDDAQELAGILDKFDHQDDPDHRQQKLERNGLLVSNARKLLHFSEEGSTTTVTSLAQLNEETLHKIYYRVWILVLLLEDSTLKTLAWSHWI